jgi:nicotinate phosphoribosyltransferase
MNEDRIPQYEFHAAPRGYQSYIKDIGPLACDRYALTMTYAAWKLGFVEEVVTTSNAFCRSYLNNSDTYKDTATDEIKPVKVPYLVNAGLGLVAEWYSGWKWKDRDLLYLAGQYIADGSGKRSRLFPDEFLYWLSKQKLTLDIKAIPEGQLIFPQEPSMQFTGLWWQQMMIEASSLALISSSTNLATVASQVRLATQRESRKENACLVEMSARDLSGPRKIEYAGLADMSLRRSPSIGAIQSARAAAIAGWDSTSNDYASMCYGIPAMGTFAHAWVMLHDTEEEAFENWAMVFPGATVFLADTYNTLEGVQKAISICKKHRLDLKGIRLDSGDLAYFSLEVYRLLKEAGYGSARILATDCISIQSAASLFGRVGTQTQEHESYVNSFGIGSEVAVNRNNPLLDFVLKLSARHADRSSKRDDLVRELIKLTDSEQKSTLPGRIDVIRYMDKEGKWAGDTIIPADLDIGIGKLSRDIHSEHIQTGKTAIFPKGVSFIRVLQPWMKNGRMILQVYRDKDAPAVLGQSRAICKEALSRMDKSHLLITPDLPRNYGVGISKELSEKRRHLKARIEKGQRLEMLHDRFNLKPS